MSEAVALSKGRTTSSKNDAAMSAPARPMGRLVHPSYASHCLFRTSELIVIVAHAPSARLDSARAWLDWLAPSALPGTSTPQASPVHKSSAQTRSPCAEGKGHLVRRPSSVPAQRTSRSAAPEAAANVRLLGTNLSSAGTCSKLRPLVRSRTCGRRSRQGQQGRHWACRAVVPPVA